MKVGETQALSYTYSGLTCGTDYSLALVAEDKAGNTSILAEAIWYPVVRSTARRHRRRLRLRLLLRGR